MSPIVPNLIQINMTVTKTLAMNPDLFDEVQMLKVLLNTAIIPYLLQMLSFFKILSGGFSRVSMFIVR